MQTAGGHVEVDVDELAHLLRRRGRVRGNPVAISLFPDTIPPAYEGRSVEPCAILRHAMDFGELVYVDADHHACVAGAWQAGFMEPPLEIRTGRYLADHTPYFTTEGAHAVKTGVNALPQGTVRAIGAAPLDRVPEGVTVDWFVVVCRPQEAATIAGVRASLDGTPPTAGAGTSLCGDMFAVPWHQRNVIMTPGDMGGRMFNHAKPDEMFVIVPVEYGPHLLTLLGERPDLTGLLEAIKPGYTAERDAKRRARATTADEPVDAPSEEPAEPPTIGRTDAGPPEADDAPTADVGFELTMPWDVEPLDLLAKAPAEIREFAGPTLEAYAAEHGHDRITMAVMAEQMESVGMSLEDVFEMLEEQQP